MDFSPTAPHIIIDLFLLPQVKSDQTEPLCFSLTPIKGYPSISPAHELKRLAREVGMEGKVRILNFGVETQMSEVMHAMEDCLTTGHWLLLQNYHLAEEEPSVLFFNTLKVTFYFLFNFIFIIFIQLPFLVNKVSFHTR